MYNSTLLFVCVCCRLNRWASSHLWWSPSCSITDRRCRCWRSFLTNSETGAVTTPDTTTAYCTVLYATSGCSAFCLGLSKFGPSVSPHIYHARLRTSIHFFFWTGWMTLRLDQDVNTHPNPNLSLTLETITTQMADTQPQWPLLLHVIQVRENWQALKNKCSKGQDLEWQNDEVADSDKQMAFWQSKEQQKQSLFCVHPNMLPYITVKATQKGSARDLPSQKSTTTRHPALFYRKCTKPKYHPHFLRKYDRLWIPRTLPPWPMWSCEYQYHSTQICQEHSACICLSFLQCVCEAWWHALNVWL